jgi:hypothetical protein
MAVVVGGWLAREHLARRRVVVRAATIGIAVVCFLGSTLYGGGPLPGLVNGPYIVGAHERSLGPPSFALANWASTHLPVGSRVAVDRDNGALLNDIGRVDPVSPLNGSENPSPLFFDQELTLSDIALIRKDDIRYVVTDTRLTEGLPLYGAYIAPGETRNPTLLTMAELQKFNSIPGVYRIYDNGAIQVYDLSTLLGKQPLSVATGTSGQPVSATGVAVPVLACLVAVVWLFRLRRRSRRAPINEHLVVCGLVGAMAFGLFWAFAVRLLHLSPGPVSVVTLLFLLLLGLRPAGWRTSITGNAHRLVAMPAPTESTRRGLMSSLSTGPSGSEAGSSDPVLAAPSQHPRPSLRAQFALGCAGFALFALGATIATAAAAADRVPPLELSISGGQGGNLVATVDLGSAAPVAARLEMIGLERVLWSTPLSQNTGMQTVTLPSDLPHSGSELVLVAGGKDIRSVSG